MPNRPIAMRLWVAMLCTALAAGAGYQLANRYLDDDTAAQLTAIRQQTAAIVAAQEAAERNGQVSACLSEYAATAEAHAANVRDLAAIIARTDRDSPRYGRLLTQVGRESSEGRELTLRRAGVALMAQEPGDFECIRPPRRLRVPAIDPRDPAPPPPG